MCLKDSKLSLLRVSIIAALANKYAKPIKKKLLIFRLNTRQNRAGLYYLHQNVISEVRVNEINFKKKPAYAGFLISLFRGIRNARLNQHCMYVRMTTDRQQFL